MNVADFIEVFLDNEIEKLEKVEDLTSDEVDLIKTIRKLGLSARAVKTLAEAMVNCREKE